MKEQLKSLSLTKIRNLLIVMTIVYVVVSLIWNALASPDIVQNGFDWFDLMRGSKQYTLRANINYIQPPDGRRRGDLYLPNATRENSKKIPIVLIMHGGSWGSGSKEDFEERLMAKYFLEHGYAAFVFDYRLLADGARFPDNIIDTRQALSFVFDQCNSWGTDPQNIFVLGSSSAAPAVLVAAYNCDNKPNQFNLDFGKCPPVKAACSISGSNDLSFDTTNIWVQQYLKLKAENPAHGNSAQTAWTQKVCAEASPKYYLDCAIPTIFIHGDCDHNVPIKRSQELCQALRARGVKSRLITVVGQTHFIGSVSRRQCLDQIIRFFDSEIHI